MSETYEYKAPQFVDFRLREVIDDSDKSSDSSDELLYEKGKENEPSLPSTGGVEPSDEIEAKQFDENPLQSPQKATKRHAVPESLNVNHVSKKPTLKVGESSKFTPAPAFRTAVKKSESEKTQPSISASVPLSRANTVTTPSLYQPPIRVRTLTNDNEWKEEEVYGFGVPLPVLPSKKTQVKPFSFEQRTREMLERKEKKIQKAYEEEKKLREFKAKPVPTFVLRPMKCNNIQAKQPSKSSQSKDNRFCGGDTKKCGGT